MKFVEKELDTTINLDDYEDIEEIDVENSITYFKDKEEFEKTHFKIIHPPIYCSLNKGKYELQSKDGIIQSYEHVKSFVINPTNNKEKLENLGLIQNLLLVLYMRNWYCKQPLKSRLLFGISYSFAC